MPPAGARAKKSQQSEKSAKISAIVQPVKETSNGGIAITIHAKPNAKESNIAGLSDEAVEVQISAPPKDGEANTELVRFMAETLGLKKSQVVLDKGSKSREKTVLLDADTGMTPNEVMDKLRAACGK